MRRLDVYDLLNQNNILIIHFQDPPLQNHNLLHLHSWKKAAVSIHVAISTHKINLWIPSHKKTKNWWARKGNTNQTTGIHKNVKNIIHMYCLHCEIFCLQCAHPFCTKVQSFRVESRTILQVRAKKVATQEEKIPLPRQSLSGNTPLLLKTACLGG